MRSAEQKWIVRIVVAVALTAACSQAESKPDTMTVQGTVSQQLRTTAGNNNDGVRAVAIGVDGRSFWSALDAQGDFKLVIPLGQAYRVVLARPPAANGSSATVAELTFKGSQGNKAKWFHANAGANKKTMRLGDLVPAGTLATSPALQQQKTDAMNVGTASRGSGRGGGFDQSDAGASTSTSSSSSDDGGGHSGSGRGGNDDGADDDSMDPFEDDQAHADDPACEEKDGSTASSMCTSSSVSEMECSRNDSSDVADSIDWKNAAPASPKPCATEASDSPDTAPTPARPTPPPTDSVSTK